MNFEELSDTISSDELKEYFKEFLKIYKNKPNHPSALKDLYELAYRQWDTYEPVSEEIAQQISEYLFSSIKFNSYDVMDTILSIVENLSLKDVFFYIVNNKEQAVNPSVRSLIDEAENDYSDIIDNPFGLIDNI